MDILLKKIFEWIRQGFIEAIMGNFTGMYDTINEKVGDIAGMILTFVMCYELIQMIIEKNNIHKFEPSALYKWIFKTFVAVYIVTHTFEIVMAVFDVAQNVINQSAGVISGNLDVGLALDALQTQLDAMGFRELFWLWMETAVIGLCIFLIIYGRMIEIYLTVSIAPIPFSTMANREWGQMGNTVDFASVTIGDMFAVHGIRVMSGEKGFSPPCPRQRQQGRVPGCVFPGDRRSAQAA